MTPESASASASASGNKTMAKGINGFLGSAFSSVNERFVGSILTERLRQFGRQRGILKVKI